MSFVAPFYLVCSAFLGAQMALLIVLNAAAKELKWRCEGAKMALQRS